MIRNTVALVALMAGCLAATPSLAQQTAWDLYGAERPRSAANIQEGMGNGSAFLRRRSQPMTDTLHESVATFGTESGDITMIVALMNVSGRALCVKPDIDITGEHGISVYQSDNEYFLLPAHSSRIVFRAGGWQSDTGSFSQSTSANVGDAPASGDCSDRMPAD